MIKKPFIGLLSAVLMVSPTAASDREKTPAEKMLERIAALTGEWQGHYVWTGARKGEGDLRVTYQTTGFGSAIVETLIQGGKPSMSTVYHLDGADLRMTHYCGARNQPRLRANQVDPRRGHCSLRFR